MAISRAAFQIRTPGGDENDAGKGGRADKNHGGGGKHSAEAMQRSDVSSGDRRGAGNFAEAEEGPGKDLPEIRGRTLRDLPPADAASAGKPEGIGPTQPETEARRSVATGRDAPRAAGVSEDGGRDEIDGGRAEGLERRLREQTKARGEYLTRIHGIVERLIELTEAEHIEGGEKLQSLEHRVAQMEMRLSVNRNSP